MKPACDGQHWYWVPFLSSTVKKYLSLSSTHSFPPKGVCYGTNLISPNSILDYLYSCVRCTSSVWLHIYEFIFHQACFYTSKWPQPSMYEFIWFNLVLYCWIVFCHPSHFASGCPDTQYDTFLSTSVLSSKLLDQHFHSSLQLLQYEFKEYFVAWLPMVRYPT